MKKNPFCEAKSTQNIKKCFQIFEIKYRQNLDIFVNIELFLDFFDFSKQNLSPFIFFLHQSKYFLERKNIVFRKKFMKLFKLTFYQSKG